MDYNAKKALKDVNSISDSDVSGPIFKCTKHAKAQLGSITMHGHPLQLSELAVEVATPHTLFFLSHLSATIFQIQKRHAAQTVAYNPVNKLTSFAPVRNRVRGRALVDGDAAYRAMADAISGAKETIFCAFWKHVPFVYLRRDPIDPESRFDRMLKKKAGEGVKIYMYCCLIVSDFCCISNLA